MKNKWIQIPSDLWDYICNHPEHNRVWAGIVDDHQTYVQKNFGEKNSIFILDMTRADRAWLKNIELEFVRTNFSWAMSPPIPTN
jgi:hypothetical protein